MKDLKRKILFYFHIINITSIILWIEMLLQFDHFIIQINFDRKDIQIAFQPGRHELLDISGKNNTQSLIFENLWYYVPQANHKICPEDIKKYIQLRNLVRGK